MTKWAGPALVVALASCGGAPSAPAPAANTITSNDFETLLGWGDDYQNPSLTQEKAHSGAHSLVVKPGLDFSLNYTSLLGAMCPSRPTRLKLQAWAYVPGNQATAKLVVEILDPRHLEGDKLLWQGIELNKEVKRYHSWQLVEKSIPIPPAVNAASLFKLYLWRAGSPEPVYVDDIKLERGE